MARTLVFVHAHPDDEALLTAGTMARASAEGHRVVLVTATAGEAGLAASGPGAALGARRLAELERSARILGVARLDVWGYPDSGLDGAGDGAAVPFAGMDPDPLADRLADLLARERAAVLVGYDASGGYGHPDHRQVHRVTARAARRTGTRLYEATAPRWPFALGARAVDRVLDVEFDPQPFLDAFTPAGEITHRVDVRDYADFKRAALRAHASQATGADVRTLGALLKLPRPVFRRLLGTEYYRRAA